MKIIAKSVMSEHSTEFCLIPRIVRILKKSYQDVTPIFPALTREFSKKSYQNQNSTFQALALFPRRPKVTQSAESAIYVTINPELCQFEEFMRKRGLPTIAGCPMVKKIWDLSCDPEISWIDISHQSLGGYLNDLNSEDVSKALLTEDEILRRARKSNSFSLDSLGDLVREFREISNSPFIYGPMYKPVFLLMT